VPVPLVPRIAIGQHRFRDGEAERLGGLEVDNKREFHRLLQREVGRTGATEDAIDRPDRSPPEAPAGRPNPENSSG